MVSTFGVTTARVVASASFSAWMNWLMGALLLVAVRVFVEAVRVASMITSGKAYRYACSRRFCAASVCCAAAAFSTGKSVAAQTTAAAVETFKKSRRVIFIT